MPELDYRPGMGSASNVGISGRTQKVLSELSEWVKDNTGDVWQIPIDSRGD